VIRVYGRPPECPVDHGSAWSVPGVGDGLRSHDVSALGARSNRSYTSRV